MNERPKDLSQGYGLEVRPLDGRVTARRGTHLLADSTAALVMYETRLPAAIYFPGGDITADLAPTETLQTFCPFKGTASYFDLRLPDGRLERAAFSYLDALPEAQAIAGHIAFMPGVATDMDLGENVLPETGGGYIKGALVNWLLREAAQIEGPEALTAALAAKLRENGVAVSRLSVMIWSLHPLIAGKNFVWSRHADTVETYAPSYEIYDHPAYVNSPLRHVSNGLGGVRQRLDVTYGENAFPILADLKKEGGTDYVAMPLAFSDGRINVLTLTSDHPSGFTTANLGLIFECSAAISRYYEVFTQQENARSLLETYVGKRSGARVLAGQIRRGDGDEIDAAIMFCDLRHSTRLEETLGRDEYIAVLNDFFETVTTIVHDGGGEVLKFIGDAVLAVFPAPRDAANARRRALDAAREITRRIFAQDEAGTPVACAIGLAYGCVTYGNVGSRARLDFTVIGQAANVAARLADHAKDCGHDIVMSSEFPQRLPGIVDLGPLSLRNVSMPVHGFALTGAAGADAVP